MALGIRCSGGGRESKACKNDKRRRGEALIKQRVGVGVPEMPAEMEAKAGAQRTVREKIHNSFGVNQRRARTVEMQITTHLP